MESHSLTGDAFSIFGMKWGGQGFKTSKQPTQCPPVSEVHDPDWAGMDGQTLFRWMSCTSTTLGNREKVTIMVEDQTILERLTSANPFNDIVACLNERKKRLR